jgi:Fe-S-cluster-containing hydrogenase component 2
MACPFGALAIVDSGLQPRVSFTQPARKCDLCTGREKGPACVEACPNEALRLIDLSKEIQEKRVAAAVGVEASGMSAKAALAAMGGAA